MMNAEQIKKCAKLNDEFRSQILTGQYGHNRVIFTSGVSPLPYLKGIMQEVVDFNTFNENNDPYGEHDMGALNINNIKFFWKIDYYDIQEKFMSPDPSNPEVTKRVLTIMKASEY